ncbi:unnamed protein product [marine sediment metagenome]|uniref:Uncharacterized protein n=1 Tax=marine sediment metagenome TaxID=412755 RepID=X1GLG2_9ZZZZ
MTNTQYFSFETKVCSQCGLTKQISELFYNQITGEYWCMYCVAIEKKKRNAKCREKTSEPDVKMKSKGGEIFRTWDEICLDKLKEIGKASLTEWATAMNYKNSASLSKPARHLEEQGKIRVIRNKSGMIKKYYEAI